MNIYQDFRHIKPNCIKLNENEEEEENEDEDEDQDEKESSSVISDNQSCYCLNVQ